MYQDFYKLERAPFNTTPDPAFFYASPVHQEALAAIAYGVENRKGFISLIGEVGTGKTTVLRTYIGSSELENTRIIYLFNPNVTFDDLLVMVLRELEIEHEIPRDQTRRIDLLHRVLVREFKRGNNVVLIIDEAQNVPPETLESIRLLTNIETDSEKLIQIILCGQPELRRLLAMQSLRQLRERIAVKTELRTLTKSEAAEYIHHRLKRARQPDEELAGVGRVSKAVSDNIFTDDAINEVIRRTGGNPRAINILCDNALITGYGYQKYPIASPIIREIARELDDGLPSKSGLRSDVESVGWLRVAGYGLAALALIAFLAIGGLMLFRALFDRSNTAVLPPVAAQTDSSVNSNNNFSTAVDVMAENQGKEVGKSKSQIAESREDDETKTDANLAAKTMDEGSSDENASASSIEIVSEETSLAQNADENRVSSGVVTLLPDTASQTATDAETQTGIAIADADSDAEDSPDAPALPSLSVIDSAQTVTENVTQRVARASELADPVSSGRKALANNGRISTVEPATSSNTTTSLATQSTDASSSGIVTGAAVQDATQNTRNGSTEEPTEDSIVVAQSADSASPQAVGETYLEIRKVKSGDMLWNMVFDVYGQASPQIMEWLLDSNPQIGNRDVINVGEDILFPQLPQRFQR